MKTKLQILKYKEGVVAKHGHFQPHIAAIFMVALETAPIMEDGTVWVTQMYRKVRDTLDFHELCAGVDFRCKTIVVESRSNTPSTAAEARRTLGQMWAERMSAKLGPDYDCIAHGSPDDAFHVHVEFDPRN
jgi:hypothetical protein